jgi:hypothetical protein
MGVKYLFRAYSVRVGDATQGCLMKFRFGMVTRQKPFSSGLAAGQDLGLRDGGATLGAELKAQHTWRSMAPGSSADFRNFISEETERYDPPMNPSSI